jgi:integrase
MVDAIWSGRRRPTPADARWCFRRALDLEVVRLHDLRHLAGTMAAATGASTKELMHRLGHASLRATLRYQHATAERNEAIADGIDRILEASQRDGDQDTNVIRFRRAAE